MELNEYLKPKFDKKEVGKQIIDGV